MTHDTVRDYRKSMKIALIITVVFLLVEIAGGLISGSLSLISDAGHMFSDVLSLVLSLGAMTLALQLPTKERTYGYHRGEIFAAFINSLSADRGKCRYPVGGIPADNQPGPCGRRAHVYCGLRRSWCKPVCHLSPPREP